ncbi:MAG: YkvA family protein [Thermoguttaceae bacterium]|nr:YkvA family protein [Thermoguttaceae bacterium]
MTVNPKDKDYDEKIYREFQSEADNFSEGDLRSVFKNEGTAWQKAKQVKGFFDEFIWGLRLLKDYRVGRYKAPWKLIAAAGFAAIYLISPIDLIPDFIPVLGFADDLSVFLFVLKVFQAEIEQYRQWKDKEIDVL